MTERIVTQQQLHQVLNYSPETGVFTWRAKVAQRVRIGDIAGSITKRGYINISLFSKLYRAHRLAWLYIYGEFPDGVIDHVNGNTGDNRIANLRVTSQKQNTENQKLHINNKSGHRGIHWHKKQQQWVAMVGHRWQKVHVGSFDRLEDAINAVKTARDLLFTHHNTEHAA